MKLDHLYVHAADLGVEVIWSARMHPQRHGLYLDDQRLIILNQGCTHAQTTSALAHELAHAFYGDRASTSAIERRADEYGARLIIAVDEYAAAESAVGHHAGALARELGVTRRMVEAWQRQFSRERVAVGMLAT